MIDIHSHIIFDVDDGPKTLEESKELLEESYRQGVRTIFSTSHRRKGMFETSEEKIQEHFQKVKELASILEETTLNVDFSDKDALYNVLLVPENKYIECLNINT